MQWIFGTWFLAANVGLLTGIVLSVAEGSAWGLLVTPFVVLAAVVASFPFRRWQGRDARWVRDLLAPAAVLLLLLAAREGAFGRRLRFDVSNYELRISGGHTTLDLGTAPWTREPSPCGLEVLVNEDGGGNGQVVRELRLLLQKQYWLAHDLRVDITADVPDSLWFTPFYKHRVAQWSLGIRAHWVAKNGARKSMMLISGTTDMKLVGLAPCRVLDERLAEHIAPIVTSAVNAEIAKP
jgi:hypothetical protein